MFNRHFSRYFHYRIENDLYEDIYYDSTHKFVYRTYRTAIKDTVYNRKIFHKNPINHNIRFQVCLEQSKPYGLQIYNQNYELIYDEIMPTPFNILKIENNEIWVHGRYDETNQKYWIYRYKLEHQKP
ncbi:MAG: hypothetical protein RML94_08005 [Bacteroidia bacterium]|nr:hypothetical protein [Bacteroidia bacterium]